MPTIYSRNLGDSVKRARGKKGMTQAEVAFAANIDSRTLLNIENYRGNPKLEVLYPLVRALEIDPREIFYPEMRIESSSKTELRRIIDRCSEEEAAALVPILTSVLDVLNSKRSADTAAV